MEEEKNLNDNNEGKDYDKKNGGLGKSEENNYFNNNENIILNKNNDENFQSNLSSNFSNQNNNFRTNINSNTNDISNEEMNKNNNESPNKNNQENKNINDININQIHSSTENINQNNSCNNKEKEIKMSQNQEEINNDIINNNKNIMNNMDLIMIENNKIDLSDEINKEKFKNNENNKDLMLEEEDLDNINEVIIEKEYSTENVDENNNKDDIENKNDEKIKLNSLEDRDNNLNYENDNELINYKNISDSEKNQNTIENKECKENNQKKELNLENIIKIEKNGNEVLELYSFEENDNNKRINENENEEFFINQNIEINLINFENDKSNNDKIEQIINKNDKDESEKSKKKFDNKEERKDENNLNLEEELSDGINAINSKKNNNNIEENNMEKINNILKGNNIRNGYEKKVITKKSGLKKPKKLIAQNDLKNVINNNIINSKDDNIDEEKKEKVKKMNLEKAKVIKGEIYKKNVKKTPYKKFITSYNNNVENKSDFVLKLDKDKQEYFFEKYKTLEIQHKDNNKSTSKKTYKITNIPFNDYVQYFAKTSLKNNNIKNKSSVQKENLSSINNKNNNYDEISFDGVVYQKRNPKKPDIAISSTSMIYSKKANVRRNTFGKYKSNPKNNKFITNNLNINTKKEKLNINENQLYTPINYIKKIPLSGQNRAKDNYYLNKDYSGYDNNYYRPINNQIIYNNRNVYLINSKTNNNNLNKVNLIYKKNNMDLSNNDMFKNEYKLNNNNNNFNINYKRKKNKDFNNDRRNDDIYNTMKQFQKNNRTNRFNQTLPFRGNNMNMKNDFIYREEYDDLAQEDLQDYEDNNNYFDKYFYLDNKNSNINIDLEDLIVLEERLNEIIYFLKSIKDVKNQCCDFMNFLLFSSLKKLENTFKNEKAAKIIKLYINLNLLSVMLCYEFSFDEVIMNKTYILLLEILEINHNSLIIILQNILNQTQDNNQNNIWVQILEKIISNSIKEKERYINKASPFYETISSNNDRLLKKLKDIFYNYQTELSSSILSLLKKINQKNYEQINDFFQEYILRKDDLFNNKNIPIKQARPPFILSRRLKKFTLILSLDETLVHLQKINNNQCSLKLRPYLFDFLESVKPYYELILFTSKTKYYTIPVMKVIQNNKNYFDFIFYREHCIILGNDYVKDLTRIGRSLDSTIIIDNLPQHFKLQKENGINIKSFWAQDPGDRALYDLIPILVNIALGEDDVRDGLEKYKDDIITKIVSNIYEYSLNS